MKHVAGLIVTIVLPIGACCCIANAQTKNDNDSKPTTSDQYRYLNYFGEAIDVLKNSSDRQIDRNKLVKNAVANVLDRFPLPNTKDAPSVKSATACNSRAASGFYRCLAFFGEVIEALFAKHHDELPVIIDVAIRGLLASAKEQTGGTVSGDVQRRVDALLAKINARPLNATPENGRPRAKDDGRQVFKDFDDIRDLEKLD